MIRTASSRAATSVPGEFEPSPMELHPVFLSSVQFAFVIAFHLLLPPFTAASRRSSCCRFLLVGTLFLLPIIFMYRLAYYVSRGKVTSHVGYH